MLSLLFLHRGVTSIVEKPENRRLNSNPRRFLHPKRMLKLLNASIGLALLLLLLLPQRTEVGHEQISSIRRRRLRGCFQRLVEGRVGALLVDLPKNTLPLEGF